MALLEPISLSVHPKAWLDSFPPFSDGSRSAPLTEPQAELEHLLTEEERRRNSKRLDQIYMLSSHPMAPDAFELADSASALDESARTQLSKALEPTITGACKLSNPASWMDALCVPVAQLALWGILGWPFFSDACSLDSVALWACRALRLSLKAC